MRTNIKDFIGEDNRRAIWQYMIDHARIRKDNKYHIHIIVDDDLDFWRRVQARKDGSYSRTTAKQVVKNAKINVKRIKKAKNHLFAFEKVQEYVKEHGNWYDRFLWKIYTKIWYKLFKKSKQNNDLLQG